MSGTQRGMRLALAYAALATASVIGQIAVGGLLSRLWWKLRPSDAPAMVTAGAAALGVMCVSGIALLVWSARLRRGTRGRLRLACLGAGGALNAMGASGLLAIFARLRADTLDPDLGWLLPPGVAPWLSAASLVTVIGALVAIGSAGASWFLIDREVRRRWWLVIDSVLFTATGLAIAMLPSRPPIEDPNALALPIVRHLLTALGVLRLTTRLVPRALDLVEAFGFESLIAARHLRAKKSGFLAAISVLAMLAVAVSCTALTATLSVMGGFRSDLKRKILGNNPHVVVDRERAQLDDWEGSLATVRRTPGVSGAAPFVSGEVMLSSASNLATAVLRGIDPETIGSVSDLPNNMKTGKLEYLTAPEKLLNLPPDAMRSPFLRPGLLQRLPEVDAGAATSTPDAGVHRDAGALADAGTATANDALARTESDAGALAQRALDLERRLADLDKFLRDPRPATAPEPRDVLPGIVIGQELARALRLFVGDEVNVVAPLGTLGPAGPMPKSRPFRVAGVFYSGMYEYDMKHTYVALETAQRFLGTDDAISGIDARVGDVERAPAAASAIRAALGNDGIRVRDWQELNKQLFGALALEKLAMFITLGIAILVASFCIIGTLTLMVQEKGREVAILKAMGAADRAIVRVFVIEGGLIGLLGSALGLFLGYMLCFAAEHFGIRMNPEVYYIDRLPVQVDLTEFALTGVAAVAVCLFVTVYPALLASRLRPVDALRYE